MSWLFEWEIAFVLFLYLYYQKHATINAMAHTITSSAHQFKWIFNIPQDAPISQICNVMWYMHKKQKPIHSSSINISNKITIQNNSNPWQFSVSFFVFSGTGEKAVVKIFNDAKRSAPCIVFIDEVRTHGWTDR